MTGTDLYKRTHKSVPVIFEPLCNCSNYMSAAAAAAAGMLNVSSYPTDGGTRFLVSFGRPQLPNYTASRSRTPQCYIYIRATLFR